MVARQDTFKPPLWLPNLALVITLLFGLTRSGTASLIPFALVITVLAVLQASLLAQPVPGIDLTWGTLLKHLLGPAVLPTYGLAAAGMLYLDQGRAGCGGAGGCTSCGGGHADSTPMNLAAPSMCGGGCGSGGCGGGKAGGGCGSGCGAGKKTATPNAKGVKAVNIPPPRAPMNAVVPTGSNLPGLNGPNAKPLPPGLVPKGGVEMPAGVEPAAPGGDPRAKGGEPEVRAAEGGSPPASGPAVPPVPVAGPVKSEVRGEKSEVSATAPGTRAATAKPAVPVAPATPARVPTGEVVKIPLRTPAPATPAPSPPSAAPDPAK